MMVTNDAQCVQFRVEKASHARPLIPLAPAPADAFFRCHWCHPRLNGRALQAEDMRLVEEFTRTMVRLMSRGPAAADEADTSSVAQKGVAGSEGETAA